MAWFVCRVTFSLATLALECDPRVVSVCETKKDETRYMFCVPCIRRCPHAHTRLPDDASRDFAFVESARALVVIAEFCYALLVHCVSV